MSVFDGRDIGPTATGALSGAGTGYMIGGPIGAAIGGVGGGLFGFLGSHGNNKGADAQKRAIDEAMARLQAFSQQQQMRRQQDLASTMKFYEPAENYLRSIYGGSPAAPPAGGGGPMMPPTGRARF